MAGDAENTVPHSLGGAANEAFLSVAQKVRLSREANVRPLARIEKAEIRSLSVVVGVASAKQIVRPLFAIAPRLSARPTLRERLRSAFEILLFPSPEIFVQEVYFIERDFFRQRSESERVCACSSNGSERGQCAVVRSSELKSQDSHCHRGAETVRKVERSTFCCYRAPRTINTSKRDEHPHLTRTTQEQP